MPAPTIDDSAPDVTRSGVVVPNLKLNEVKKVFIDVRGNAAPEDFRRELLARFGSSRGVTATTNADEADASLRIVLSHRGSQIEASVRLINARGVVLWPRSGRGTRRYSGEQSIIVSNILNDLQTAISQ